MTFNILFAGARSPAGPWEARRPLAVGVIRRWAPDVVGLQEPLPQQLTDLAADLPEYGVVWGPSSGPNRLPVWALTGSPIGIALWALIGWWRRGKPRRRGWRALRAAILIVAILPSVAAIGSWFLAGAAADRGEFCAILYRKERLRPVAQGAFWLSERPDRPGSVTFGSWLPRVTNWARFRWRAGGGSVSVYNAHFDYLNPWVRTRMAGVLRSRLDRAWDGSLQVLLGDLNDTSESAAFRVLGRPSAGGGPPPFQDAWDTAARREGPEFSLHGGIGTYRWPGRIDHILFRPPGAVSFATTITDHAGTIYPSDHYPVLADIPVAR